MTDTIVKQHVYPVLVKRSLLGALIVVAISLIVWGIPSFLWLKRQISPSSLARIIFAHIFLVSGLIPLFAFVGITLNRSHAGGLGILKSTIATRTAKWTISVLTSAIIAATMHSLFYDQENDSSYAQIPNTISQTYVVKPLLPMIVLCWTLHDLLTLNKSFQLIHLCNRSLFQINPWISMIWEGTGVSLRSGLLVLTMYVLDKCLEAASAVVPFSLPAEAEGLFSNLLKTWNNMIFTDSAFLLTLFVTVLTSFTVKVAIQVFSYLWLLPIDFAKIVSDKKPTEETLLASLRILQSDQLLPSSNACPSSVAAKKDEFAGLGVSSLYTAKFVQYMKQTDQVFKQLYTNSSTALPIDSYYGMDASDCISSLPSFFGLDSYNVEMYFGLLSRSLAFHDLNRLVKGNSVRRKMLLNGKAWENLLDATMSMLIECAVQIQAVNSHLREPKPIKQATQTRTGAPADSSSQATSATTTKPREPITVSELRALKKSGYYTGHVAAAVDNRMTASSTTASPTLVESLEIFWDNNVQPQVTDLLLKLQGFPLRGELDNEQNRLPRHIGEFLRSLFSPLMSQTLVNAIESIAIILEASLKEDKEGITIQSVPAILYVLLKLDLSFDKYAGILQQSYTAKIANARGVQYIRYKIYESQYLPNEVTAICNANKESILCILRNFSDLIVIEMFPQELQQQLKTYISEL